MIKYNYNLRECIFGGEVIVMWERIIKALNILLGKREVSEKNETEGIPESPSNENREIQDGFGRVISDNHSVHDKLGESEARERELLYQQIFSNLKPVVLPEVDQASSTPVIMQLLSGQIGLEKVAEAIDKFVKQIGIRSKMAANAGVDIEQKPLHVAIGTDILGQGDIIAQAIAKLYKIKGLIQQDNVYILDMQGLKKLDLRERNATVDKICAQAKGGVLLIQGFSNPKSKSGDPFIFQYIHGSGTSFSDTETEDLFVKLKANNITAVIEDDQDGIEKLIADSKILRKNIGISVLVEKLTIEQKSEYIVSLLKKKGFDVEPDALRKIRPLLVDLGRFETLASEKSILGDIVAAIVDKHLENIQDENDAELKSIKASSIPEKTVDLFPWAKTFENAKKAPLIKEGVTLDDLVGMEEPKRQFEEVRKTLELYRAMGADGKETRLHMQFVGDPGVGKTTFVHFVAQEYHAAGFIRENKVVYCTAKDLVASYVGHSALRTQDKIDEAKGGILFIDEIDALIID